MSKRTVYGIPRKKLLLIIVLGIALVLSIVLASCLNRKHSQGAGTQQINAPVMVSEVMISNTGSVTDSNGKHPDYVELYNNSDEVQDISGWTLSDREDRAWLFPNGTLIQPRSYLVVWCTGEKVNDALIADFKLGSGDVLRFTDGSGNLILSMELKDLYAGYVMAYNIATGQWEQQLPSPGYPNTAEGIAAFEQSKELKSSESQIQQGNVTAAHNGVYISEFMPSNGLTTAGPDGSYPDWIELHNVNSTAVDLSGCGISDDEAKPYKFTFPEGTVIEGGAYLVLWSCKEQVDGYICLNFSLSSRGETIVLSDKNGGILDKVSYENAQKDCAFARAYNDLGEFDPSSSFGVTDKPTPGYPNTVAGFNAFDSQRNPEIGVHDISLNEILSSGYRWVMKGTTPWDEDLGKWVELYNASDEPVNLTGWSLSDSANKPDKWVFPDGTSIAGKGYLILNMKDSLPREGLKEDSVTSEMKALTLNFSIAGEGETLYLYDRDKNLADRVTVPAARACVSYARGSDGEWGFSETPTEGAANTGVTKAKTYCEEPVFSLGSGLYHGAQAVTISVPAGCYVTYTTDCTTPTENSPRYQSGQSLQISENSVLRARSFANDGSAYKSEAVSATYVIIGDTPTQEAHDTNLNVVFLVTDPDNLFNVDSGIYVIGSHYKGTQDANDWYEKTHYMGANFNQRGREWEREAYMTYTSPGGSQVEYEQNLMIRIFGSFSRYDSMKGIALIARKGYGSSRIQYPFFADRPFTEYKSLVLRASAKDWNRSRIRDVLILGLANDANLDMAVQAYVQTLVYINGQYWGVYNLREKVSRNYLAQHYSIKDVNSIDILRGNGTFVSGSDEKKAENDYKALIQYCKDHNCDLSDKSAYDYVCSQVDVENYAMYIALEIIVGNTDTGNIKFWRSSEKDNRWRWLPYDFDWAMNPNDDKAVEVTSGYRRDFFYRYFKEKGHGANAGFSTVLSRSLLQNNEFVEIFLKYCAIMFNDVYSTEKLNAKIDELADNIDAEMQWDFPRWKQTLKNWRTHINNLKSYAKNYPPYFLKYCKEYINKYTNYRLTDEKMIELFGRAE